MWVLIQRIGLRKNPLYLCSKIVPLGVESRIHSDELLKMYHLLRLMLQTVVIPLVAFSVFIFEV